jgi:hypothetical protein
MGFGPAILGAMTFQELESKFGKQTPENWHQHKNGGAWIYKDAKVAEDVYIGEKATVWGGIIRGGIIRGGIIRGGTIAGGTIWGGIIEGGTIAGGTIWGGTIEGGTIAGGTIWGGTIRGGTIAGGTIWGGIIEGGTIAGGTIWGGTIADGEWKTTPLFISGSRFELSNAKPGHLQIGCECHPFSWWTGPKAKALARHQNFSPEEIKEYRAYIKLFKTIGK